MLCLGIETSRDCIKWSYFRTFDVWATRPQKLVNSIANLRGRVNKWPAYPMTETVTDFMPCFNTCFIPVYKIARVSSHSLIRYWMSNMASDAKACFSSKVQYRAIIRYLYFKGKTDQEIHGKLTDIYGSSAPSYAQVKFWVGEFKRCRTSLEDEARSGRPLEFNDEENCKKDRDLVYSDRRIQVEEIAQTLGISHGKRFNNLTWSFRYVQAHSPLGPKIPLAKSKWQPEHQYAAPCWSVLGQRWFSFASGDCRWDLSSLLWARE